MKLKKSYSYHELWFLVYAISILFILLNGVLFLIRNHANNDKIFKDRGFSFFFQRCKILNSFYIYFSLSFVGNFFLS